MVQELAEDLTRRGHRVTVVTGWPSHPQGALYPGWHSAWRRLERCPEGYDVLRCGHSFGPRKRLLHRLWYTLTYAVSTFVNALTLPRVDVFMWGMPAVFGSVAYGLLARLKGARFVYYVPDLMPEAIQTAGMISQGRAFRLMKAVDAWLCRRADLVTTLSENLRSGIASRGIDPAKIRVIPFWIDGQKVRPGEHDNPWRRQHGIAPETFVALYAGTIGYVSGAGVLADVAGMLADRKDILLLVVGEGPVKDDLQAAAVQRRLSNLQFLPFQPTDQLNDMQATADVGLVTLLPAAGDNSVPSKVLGYLAAGRAVIASVHEGSPTAQTLRQGRCGWAVPPQDARAMAEAIRHAADHRGEPAELGRNAREHFLRHFDRHSSVLQWEQALLSTMAKRRPGRSSLEPPGDSR